LPILFDWVITVTDALKSVTAFAPASVSNVACGFDVMGFAIDGLGDRVTVSLSDSPGVHIAMMNSHGSAIPVDPARNTAGPPATGLLARSGSVRGIDVKIEKGFASGSGLGSSAASAVAAAAACNVLLGIGLSASELLPYAMEGETAASGAIHADNVGPSLLGGFTLIRGYAPLDVIRLSPPGDLWCAIILPKQEISTKASRKLLPQMVPLHDVVTQTGNAAGLVAGLLTGDYGLIGRSLHDVIAEPARAHTITGFAAMKRAALDAGALGCSISGSGPALFALCQGKSTGRRVADAMAQALAPFGVGCSTYCSRISPHGATIVAKEAA
jgi:homoserine kinase